MAVFKFINNRLNLHVNVNTNIVGSGKAKTLIRDKTIFFYL